MLEVGRRWACIALGSNIEPGRHLPWAVRSVAPLALRSWVSSAWQSAPVGYLEQADFVNAAMLLELRHDAAPLHRWLKQIETRLGRRRDPRNKNAPRTIDLDLVAWHGATRRAAPILPDPEIPARPFLLWPLLEVAAALRLADSWPSLDELARLVRRPQAGLLRRPDIVLRAPGVVAAPPRVA